jgi:hypothetical protein
VDAGGVEAGGVEPGGAPAIRSGQALKVYQILLILAVGWLAGRLPQMFDDEASERARLMQSIVPAEAAASATAVDPARLAADVAARVAADVANQTVAKLIAAGWGPRAAPPQVIVQQLPAGSVRPAEATVRIVTEPAPPQQLSGLDYRLPPGPSASPTPAPAAQPQPSAAAHAMASEGYAALKAGDKREGVRLLSGAVAMAPDAPQAAAWQADVKRLTKRWTVAAYTLARGGGAGDALAASPVLGGGQSGAAVAYMLDPLARRPISLVGRVAAAAGPDGGLDRESAEAALGVRVQPLVGVPIAVDVERRFALGIYSRNAWAARVSGGAAHGTRLMNRKINLEAYGEAGLVGFNASPDLYAGGQARGATPLFMLGKVELDAGAGAWGGVQRSFGTTASRLDLGPSARFRVTPFPFTAQVDYRVRTAGNALPGTGPVLTVAGQF